MPRTPGVNPISEAGIISGGAGLRLLNRQYYGGAGAVTLTIPSGVAFLRASLLGRGGAGSGYYQSGGGGGAYARATKLVASGQQLTLTDPSASLAVASASLSGSVILAADYGRAGGNRVDGISGVAANSIGDVTVSGSLRQPGQEPTNTLLPCFQMFYFYNMSNGQGSPGTGSIAPHGWGGSSYNSGGNYYGTEDGGYALFCIDYFDQNPKVI